MSVALIAWYGRYEDCNNGRLSARLGRGLVRPCQSSDRRPTASSRKVGDTRGWPTHGADASDRTSAKASGEESLELLVLLFGVVCCCIGLAHVALGPKSIYGSVPVNPTTESEDRFFGTLFSGFGAALIWSSRDLLARAGVFQALLLVFFLGGLARLILAVAVGLPNDLFIFLGLVELILPALWSWHRRVTQPTAHD